MADFRSRLGGQLFCALALLAGCGRMLGIDDLEFVEASGGAASVGDAGAGAGAAAAAGADGANAGQDDGANSLGGNPPASAGGVGANAGDGGDRAAAGEAGTSTCATNEACPRLVSPVGDPSFFIRHDGTDAILTAAENAHLYELAGIDHWSLTDVTTRQYGNPPPSMAGVPAAYRRSDRYDAILYRSIDEQIIEVYSRTDTWYALNLSAITAGPRAKGNPSPYLRSDGFNAVPYRGVDDRVWEIFLWRGQWEAAEISYGGPDAAGDPRAFVRADDANSVIYRNSSNQFTDVYLYPGNNWVVAALSPEGATEAASDGDPYVRDDFRNALVYRGTDNHIYELCSAWNDHVWTSTDLTAVASAPSATGEPHGYSRSDGVDAVVFVDAAQHVFELERDGIDWTVTDVSTLAGALPAASNPRPYVRSDSVNAIAYLATDGRLYELALLDHEWKKRVVYDKSRVAP